MKVLLIAGILLFVFTGKSYAQVIDAKSSVLEEKYPYKRSIYKERKVIPYEHLREADVFYERIVWRDIFIKEKMNYIFNYPKHPFIDLLIVPAEKGELTVYEVPLPKEEEFEDSRILTVDQILAKRYSDDTTEVMDPITGEYVVEVAQTDVVEYIKKYRIKEHWIFDKQTSTMIVRIVGICPYYEETDVDGNFVGDVGLFWVFYPDLRPYLVNTEVYNRHNYARHFSWDDIFEMRFFSSYIIKVDNVRDYEIGASYNGIDALLQSERIRQEIFEFEHNLWSF